MSFDNVASVPASAVGASPNPVSTAPSLDADLAAFFKEEPAAASGESKETLADTDVSDSPALAQVPDDDDDGENTADTAEGDADKQSAAPKDSDNVDVVKLIAAVDAEDLPALIEALGPAAEKLLTSSAHKALRLAAKDLTNKKKEAAAVEAKAHALATRLSDTYSDPIEIRKAVEKQDPKAVDMFIDYAEKTTGADWNSIMKWAASGMVGRQSRLEQRKATEATQATQQTQEQQQALEQTKTWVNTELTKSDAALTKDFPEITEMVIQEIRVGYTKGVVNPAKALPLVLKKLEAQRDSIDKILIRNGKGKKAPTPAPAARVDRVNPDQKTRPRTLEEDIAATKKEMGIR